MTDDSIAKLSGPEQSLEFDKAAADQLRHRLELQRLTTAASTEATQVIPYLTVANATRAIEFYVSVFGATLIGEPFETDDGKITHAELRIGSVTLYLSDIFLEATASSPDATTNTAVSLVIHVADADLTMAAAQASGAVIERAVQDQWGTRAGWFVDPFGHRWSPTSHRTPTKGTFQ